MIETARNYSGDDEIDLLETEVDALEVANIVDEESETTPGLAVGKFAVDRVVELEEELPADDEPDEKIAFVNLTVDSVKDYLRAIGKVPLLKAEQEVELGMSIEVGLMAEKKIEELLAEDPEFAGSSYMRELMQIQHEGKVAFDHLVLANLRLVVSIAKRYQGHGMDFLELIQEGNLGVIRAVQKFDYTKGFKFSTYATWWIRQAITRSIADRARTIRIPVHMVETINKMNAIRRSWMQDFQKEPTLEELAKELDIPLSRVEDIVGYNREPRSLNMKLGNDNETELGDLIEDKLTPEPIASSETDEFMTNMTELVDSLPKREADVIRRRYGLDGRNVETFESIAKSYGVSREAIRISHKRAMKLLRKATEGSSAKSGLRDYLDL